MFACVKFSMLQMAAMQIKLAGTQVYHNSSHA